MKIRELRSGLFLDSGCRVIELRTRGDEPFPTSSVHFRPRRIWRPIARLLLVQTEPKSMGRGYGSSVFAEFVKRVGHGPVISSEIAHTETWTALRRLGLLRLAYEQGEYKVKDPGVLRSDIPITEFLSKAGMSVWSLRIRLRRHADSYQAIERLHDSTRDHFLSFFQTRITGWV